MTAQFCAKQNWRAAAAAAALTLLLLCGEAAVAVLGLGRPPPSSFCPQHGGKGRNGLRRLRHRPAGSGDGGGGFVSPPTEPDPREFVELLGKITPSPEERSAQGTSFESQVEANLNECLNGKFLNWLNGKTQLARTMGNQSAVEELEALQESISAAITRKLAPATELIEALVGTSCSGARGQLMREILILPRDHPLYLAPDAPNRQFGDPGVDPHDFYPAHIILGNKMKEQGKWEEASEMMSLVLEECKSILRGEADINH